MVPALRLPVEGLVSMRKPHVSSDGLAHSGFEENAAKGKARFWSRALTLCFPVSQTRKLQNAFFYVPAPCPDLVRPCEKPSADGDVALIFAAHSVGLRVPGQRDGGG